MTIAGEKSQARSASGRSGLSDKKRQAILQGAKAAFLKEGFGGASMDQVAALAGVSKMTVYRHFGSKEDLFAGVITELCHFIVAEDLDAIFASRTPPTCTASSSPKAGAFRSLANCFIRPGRRPVSMRWKPSSCATRMIRSCGFQSRAVQRKSFWNCCAAIRT